MSDLNQEFGKEFQQLMLAFMIAAPEAFTQSQDIIKPEYFDDRLRPAARYILEYAEEFRKLPSVEQIKAMTNVEVLHYPQAESQTEWYLKNIEEFCRRRAIENVILDSIPLIEKGQGGEIERRLKAALEISLIKDLGTSYFADPVTRLERLKDKSNFIPTGWNSLDEKLHGGFTRGSLNIFAGGSGSGKSLFLQNLARKWSLMGKNVIYITLELSEDLVNLRLDAMITRRGTKDVLKNVKDAAMVIGSIVKREKPGDLKVKKFPEAGTTCNTIRAYLKEYQIQEGRVPDILIIDYLDLMHPNNAKIDISNMFTKDKYVSEEMRAIGTDFDIPVVSASQLNRSSVDAQEFDHSHIAGGISKINTADNVFGISTSMTMKERGVYHLQFLKTRSSSATGQRIELSYDTTTMAIEDSVEIVEEIVKTRSLDDIRGSLRGPTSTRMTPPKSIPPGSSISQMAHPAGLGREPAVQEDAQSVPITKDLNNDLAALIARQRKNNEN